MPGFLCVCQAAGLGVVELRSAGPGSDLSEELVVGVEPAALDVRVAPECPPGPAAKRCSSASMSRQTRSASRRFKQRWPRYGTCRLRPSCRSRPDRCSHACVPG